MPSSEQIDSVSEPVVAIYFLGAIDNYNKNERLSELYGALVYLSGNYKIDKYQICYGYQEIDEKWLVFSSEDFVKISDYTGLEKHFIEEKNNSTEIYLE